MRSRPLSAEPPAESPSTRNSSDESRSRVVQSISLPGSPPPPRMLLRSRTACRAFASASRTSAARMTFWTIRRASLGFSSRYLVSTSWTAPETIPSISGLLRRILVWASNCGFGQVDVDDGRQAVAEVFALGLQIVLEELFLLAVGVDGAGQAAAEADQVGAAVRVVLVVGVAADPLLVAGRVLQGDFDRDAMPGAFAAGGVDLDFLADEDGRLVDHVVPLRSRRRRNAATPPSNRNVSSLPSRSSLRTKARPRLRKASSRRRFCSVSNRTSGCRRRSRRRARR